jgi:hypothetical protein
MKLNVSQVTPQPMAIPSKESQKARQEAMAKEDEAIFRVLNNVGKEMNIKIGQIWDYGDYTIEIGDIDHFNFEATLITYQAGCVGEKVSNYPIDLLRKDLQKRARYLCHVENGSQWLTSSSDGGTDWIVVDSQIHPELGRIYAVNCMNNPFRKQWVSALNFVESGEYCLPREHMKRVLVDEDLLNNEQIENINRLMKSVRQRMDNSDSNIFSVDQYAYFIERSLSTFNEIPKFSLVSFKDTRTIQNYHNVLVQGAVLFAHSIKDMMETKVGVDIKHVTMSEMMQTKWAPEWNNHFEKLKLIKNHKQPIKGEIWKSLHDGTRIEITAPAGYDQMVLFTVLDGKSVGYRVGSNLFSFLANYTQSFEPVNWPETLEDTRADLVPENYNAPKTNTCTKCKKDYPYADKSAGFVCWGCKSEY